MGTSGMTRLKRYTTRNEVLLQFLFVMGAHGAPSVLASVYTLERPRAQPTHELLRKIGGSTSLKQRNVSSDGSLSIVARH